MESRNSSSENEGEYNDQDFMDHLDLEADKNRIVEHSPKGRFIRFNEELGSGAYKTVYKGYDNETGCEIAWNVIKLPKLPPKERKRISDEIALLKKLKHPNIISFISAWINKQKEEIVFITEVVTGGSLKKYLKKIKSPRLKVIKSWCREILQGIEYLHELKPHPIIHRDIKCDNIFINSNKGEIRIGDLGLATLMSNAYAASVLGTPEFMAPEMYDEVYGPSVDIYSFGMCLLEMVTNQTPYRECMNPAQIYKKVINGVKPASLGLIANEEVKGFICECLKPRDERLSAKELLNHHFLQSTDQEADNQPVVLNESPIDNINESELAYSIKQDVYLPKEINHELDEGNDLKDDKETSLNNVNSAVETLENIPINQKGHVDQSALQKRKSSDCAHAEEKKNESIMASAVGKFKSFDHISTILNSQKNTEREYMEDTKHDPLQEKIDLSYQSKQTQQSSTKKDQAKYSFHSKGVMNGNLVILIKVDMQGRQFEHIVEIRRDKISYEKVTSKLQKHLSFLPVANDADFRNQVKALLESIDYLNISTFMNSGIPPLNSATSIQIKSPSNGNFEAHSNEKSANTAFQAQLFAAFYDKYLTQLMRDNLWNETEESMALRQQGELLELQNRHLIQKRTLWDKKHNVLSNSTIAIQSQTIETDDAHHRMNQIYDSHFKQSEAKMKELGQNNFFFSPLSSGPLSPTTSDNLGSANISVEIMAALLKKLGNTADDQNKSNSHHPDNFSENEKVTKSNLASPNNQDVFSKAVIEKGGSVFKFPVQLNNNANANAYASTTHQICHKNNELITAALNNKISPKTQTVYSSVASPKDLPQIICSPKGFKNLTYIPQDNKTTPLKSVSDKEELHQRKFIENPSQIATDEEKLSKLHQLKIPIEENQIKKQEIMNKEKKSETLDNKKENRYGSLTINTDITNHAEKGQTPSQVQEKPSSKSRNEDQIKPDFSGVSLPQKAVSDPQAEQKTVKLDEPLGETKKTSSTPKPASVSNCIIKPSAFKDQTSSNCGHIMSGPSVLPKNSPLNSNLNNQTKHTNQNRCQEISGSGVLHRTEDKTQPLCPPQQNFSTPKSLGNHNKCSSASKKGVESTRIINIEVSGLCVNRDEQAQQKDDNSAKKIGEGRVFGFKRQPTYDILKTIKAYKMSQTLGKHVIENNSEDIKILQLCLELLTGQEINSGGQFTPYLENQVKNYQEKSGLIADGIVTSSIWEKMIGSLEKMEKKWMTKEYLKQKEIDDLTRDREDLKKKMKDKQNKEASESLTKIESKLVDLSSLL